MKGQATKCDGAGKMKSCGYQAAHPVCNASLTTKASGAYYQGGLLEVQQKSEKSSNNTPIGHHKPHE